ncbi:uncharacterized protein LOC114931569 [Nylanderia fulva]|uniref:uncharacterized protein LOC114931569 n=1 Tax=Nylanderia fulva TaxID=613905 RepID=UPI0010FBB0B4|nr:uncharacterized protein LOC114931569 [Nylanderia fulva]
MGLAKAAINLADFGLTGLRSKRAATGALLLEVPGEGGSAIAEQLAARMAEALAGTGIKVARPIKRVEVRISNPDSTDEASRKEVISSLASVGGCPEGDIRVGDIRRAPSGLGTLWVQAPLAAARRIAAASDRRDLVVGWVIVRAEVLATRPLQCYRCLEVGHPSQRCTSAVDRSGRCYRCGGTGHTAAKCEATPSAHYVRTWRG